MNKKNVITWKDADQNLCTLAASILSNSMAALRSPLHATLGSSWPLEGGGMVERGYAQKSGSERTWATGDNSRAFIQIDIFHDDPLEKIQPTVQCWWCFQNLIRQRLNQARQELQNNRYRRDREKKKSIQISRNPNGRPEGSKFGRRPERE